MPTELCTTPPPDPRLSVPALPIVFSQGSGSLLAYAFSQDAFSSVVNVPGHSSCILEPTAQPSAVDFQTETSEAASEVSDQHLWHHEGAKKGPSLTSSSDPPCPLLPQLHTQLGCPPSEACHFRKLKQYRCHVQKVVFHPCRTRLLQSLISTVSGSLGGGEAGVRASQRVPGLLYSQSQRVTDLLAPRVLVFPSTTSMYLMGLPE